MSRLSKGNPSGRFTGLADLYAQCRPSYPQAAVRLIIDRCRLGERSLMVDVGCGTGISSRLFALSGVPVLGIEPNQDMRRAAEAESVPESFPAPVYREGTAEATGLPPHSADAVLAAQAFHWFDEDKSLAEFHRILKPHGWAVLMWNERDQSKPFTAAYGNLLRTLPDTSAVETQRGLAGTALLKSPLFCHCERVLFTNEQTLDQQGLLGRAFSASYVPHEGVAAEAFAEELEALFSRYEKEGRVTLSYETSVYLGQPSPVASLGSSSDR